MPGGIDEESGEAAVDELLDGPPVTAATAFNDHCAAGLLSGLRARNVVVPTDLSVVGYDDTHLAGLSSMALTTVAQNAGVLAATAVELAVHRAEHGERDGREVVVAPEPGGPRHHVQPRELSLRLYVARKNVITNY